MAIFQLGPPNEGVKCRWGRQKSRFSTSISLHCDRLDVINTMPPDSGKLVTLIVGSKQRSLLMAGDDDKVFMTRSLNVTPKTIEQNLIIQGV